MFRSSASDRELFWIRKLHSGKLRSDGLNMQGGTRRNSLHTGIANPMKWRRNKSKHNPDPDAADVDLTRPADPTKTSRGRRFLYRDWQRRCSFIAKHIANVTFDKNILRKYKHKNLLLMLKWIENNASDKSDMVSVAHVLREHLVLRSKSTDTETKAPFKLSFELLWQSNKLQKIR